jgi:hypothetical protein
MEENEGGTYCQGRVEVYCKKKKSTALLFVLDLPKFNCSEIKKRESRRRRRIKHFLAKNK